MDKDLNNIKYSIFDPTGNITALVETRIEADNQPAVSDEIMKAHPEVEQVGFVYFEPGRPVPVLLRMAGGEFCGNAAMSAAALYKIRTGDEAETVMVRVSGTSEPVEVRIKETADGSRIFGAGVKMPPAVLIKKIRLNAAGITEELPLIQMEGISHIIIDDDRRMYALKDEPEESEAAVRKWCEMIGADCLGIMFLSYTDSKDEAELVPLVYVPGADTVFREGSCASGTAAAGMYLADIEGEPVDMTMNEPAGALRVTGKPGGTAILYGTVNGVSESQVNGDGSF